MRNNLTAFGKTFVKMRLWSKTINLADILFYAGIQWNKATQRYDIWCLMLDSLTFCDWNGFYELEILMDVQTNLPSPLCFQTRERLAYETGRKFIYHFSHPPGFLIIIPTWVRLPSARLKMLSPNSGSSSSHSGFSVKTEKLGIEHGRTKEKQLC